MDVSGMAVKISKHTISGAVGAYYLRDRVERLGERMTQVRTDDHPVLGENRWATSLRGLLGILIGFIAFFLPLPTMIGLVWLFGAYAFLDGFFNLIGV
jgi:hypothetical protein